MPGRHVNTAQLRTFMPPEPEQLVICWQAVLKACCHVRHSPASSRAEPAVLLSGRRTSPHPQRCAACEAHRWLPAQMTTTVIMHLAASLANPSQVLYGLMLAKAEAVRLPMHVCAAFLNLTPVDCSCLTGLPACLLACHLNPTEQQPALSKCSSSHMPTCSAYDACTSQVQAQAQGQAPNNSKLVSMM